jgi:hypothetical protein
MPFRIDSTTPALYMFAMENKKIVVEVVIEGEAVRQTRKAMWLCARKVAMHIPI